MAFSFRSTSFLFFFFVVGATWTLFCLLLPVVDGKVAAAGVEQVGGGGGGGVPSNNAPWADEEEENSTRYIPPVAEQQKPDAVEAAQIAVSGWAPTQTIASKAKKSSLTEAGTREVMMKIAQEMGVDVDLEHVDDMAPLMRDLSTMIQHQTTTADSYRQHRTLLDRSMGQRAHMKLVKKMMKYFPEESFTQLDEKLYHMQKAIQEFAIRTPNANYMDVVKATALKMNMDLEDHEMRHLQSHMSWIQKVLHTLNPDILGPLSEQKAEEL